MTAVDHAELKREMKRVRYERDNTDVRGYAIDEDCDKEDCGAREVPAYSEKVRASVLALIAQNAALLSEIEGLKAKLKEKEK